MVVHASQIRRIFLSLWLTFFISACTVVPSQEPTATVFNLSRLYTASATYTLTVTVVPPVTPPSTFSPTATNLPSKTPKPSPSVTTTPTITPTFDASLIITRTPAQPAQCPDVIPGLTPEFNFDDYLDGHFIRQILEFLNSGGPRKAVIKAYRQEHPWADDRFIQERDITADGIPELLFAESDSLVAFICEGGQYQDTWLLGQTYHFYTPEIITFQDMNLDGVVEIMSAYGDLRIRVFNVFEWDGSKFNILNEPSEWIYMSPCSHLYGPSWVDIMDVDGNGTLELVLKQEIPIWSEYSDGLPWRKETRTCTWNGKAFVLIDTQLAPPEFRFQAVQDGDQAVLQGEYEKALAFYQQTIFDDQLDWWTQERRRYEIEVNSSEEIAKPTPLPSLKPDPAEYPTLAAYAYYRIMLLYVVQDSLPEAQIAYNTLQGNFPPGKLEHAYVEMASSFWLGFQQLENISQACDQAIAYATTHPKEILSYLGNSDFSETYFGEQSLFYTPVDICPFH